MIERGEGSVMDRLRSYKVMIDGQYRGSIRQKEKWSFDVAAGTHEVSFKVEPYRSQPMNVAVATRTRLVCESAAARAFGMLGVFSPGSWISVREEEPDETLETPYPTTLFGQARGIDREAASSPRSALGPATPRRHGSLRLSDPKMDPVTRARRLLELDLQDAVAARKLEIRYKPQIDLATRRITTFEALLHWRHPVHGKIPAADFVPLAEDLGLICQVGQEVLQEACREAATWPAEVRVAVNLKGGQLADAAFPAIVAAALEAAGLQPSRLVLEVSAAIVMNNVPTLQVLRDMGVRIAIDDYGATWPMPHQVSSSVAASLIDEIKIHRSLVSGLGDSRERLGAVRDAISLCARLDIPCCAVGVESKDDMEILRGENCPQVQGHLFGAALAARDVAGVLARWNPFGLEPAANRNIPAVRFDQIIELANDFVIVTTADLASPGSGIGPAGGPAIAPVIAPAIAPVIVPMIAPVIAYVNQAFLRISEYAMDELIGFSPALLQAPDTDPAALAAMTQGAQTGHKVHDRFTFRSKSGALYALEMVVAPVRNDSGAITHFAMVGREATLERRAGEVIPSADRDALTGVANAPALMRLCGAEMEAAASRAPGAPPGPCLALINVNEYKAIREECGPAARDAVLRGVCERLGDNIRRLDILGRLGGDQFAVCLPSISLRDAELMAQCLRSAVAAAPFETPGGLVPVTISVGVAAFSPGDTLGMLLERAGNAFGAARHAGRGLSRAQAA
jgi:diguanylate cyclase (GGDEF)-like protein/PAS domain S-box-containing protein